MNHPQNIQANTQSLDLRKNYSYVRGMKYDEKYDARGLLCPLPVLKARKKLLAMEAGQILCVLADDPAAIIDMPHFCSESGHEFIDCSDHGTHQSYFIKAG